MDKGATHKESLAFCSLGMVWVTPQAFLEEAESKKAKYCVQICIVCDVRLNMLATKKNHPNIVFWGIITPVFFLLFGAFGRHYLQLLRSFGMSWA